MLEVKRGCKKEDHAFVCTDTFDWDDVAVLEVVAVLVTLVLVLVLVADDSGERGVGSPPCQAVKKVFNSSYRTMVSAAEGA